MPGAFIEHVNITVRDPERSAKLMHDLFGWTIRWQGPSLNGGHTIHGPSLSHSRSREGRLIAIRSFPP